MGDITQAKTAARISSQAVQSLAKMGRLCHELSELMAGKLGEVFREIATAIAKYQEDEKKGSDLEVAMTDRLAFWWVSLIKDTVDQKPVPAFVRVDRPQIEALLAFSQLFEGEESLLPWNGPGIREAVRGLPMNLVGDEQADRSLISHAETLQRLRGLGAAFHIAVEEMKRLGL